MEIEAASLIVSICSVIIAIFACIATIVTASYTKKSYITQNKGYIGIYYEGYHIGNFVKKIVIKNYGNSPAKIDEINVKEKNKLELLEAVQYSSNLANMFYVRQKEQKGLGHAIWTAKQFIGNEPFAVLLGDDIVQADTPAIKQLMNQYETTGKSIIGVQQVNENETHRYGIVDPIESRKDLFSVNRFVEKPHPGTAPSNLAIMGRYVLTPQIFDYLGRQEIGAGGEIQLTDAIEHLNSKDCVYAYNFEGERYDVGEKIGFVKTTIQFALNDDYMKKEITEFIKSINILILLTLMINGG